MRKEVIEFVKNPVLTEKDAAVLQFSPRAIVHGLQGIGLTIKEQFAILSAILKRYGKMLDDVRREYLASEVTALQQYCA
jgi:hypothetical protein